MRPPYQKRSLLRENWPANYQDYPELGSAAFEDYEEGIWTPGIMGLTTAGSPTYSAQAGFFTRVGNLVHLEMRLVVTDIGGAVGILAIRDLPYNHIIAGNAGNRPTMNFGFWAGLANVPAGTTMIQGFYQDAAVVRLITVIAPNANAYVVDTHVSGTITLYGSMTYRRN